MEKSYKFRIYPNKEQQILRGRPREEIHIIIRYEEEYGLQ